LKKKTKLLVSTVIIFLIAVSLTMCQLGGRYGYLSSKVPEFPWPPPKASAMETLPSAFFHKVKGNNIIKIADVDSKINAALESCGYYERSYYAVPDGFALVTRLERINPDGTPKPQEERWSVEVGPLRGFSLDAYVQALFTSNPGLFRIIVFIVTPHAFSQTDTSIERTQAIAWLYQGLNKLPSEIANQLYTQNHSCTVLIYEFEKTLEQRFARALVPGRLAGRTPLRKSAIWEGLQR
jgi:hypothetical protein